MLRSTLLHEVQLLSRHFGTTLTNQNSVQEQIKSRLRSGTGFYHSLQNRLSSSLLSRNIKIEIYRTIILLVVLCGCETLSLNLREGRGKSIGTGGGLL